jgi:hypothetical protein
MAGIRVNLGLLKAEVGDMLVREDLVDVILGYPDRVFYVHHLFSALNIMGAYGIMRLACKPA